jgi:hypothetical protein
MRYEAIHRLDVPYTSSSHRKDADMINGAHAILYSDDADATRATLAKALGTRSVDAGGGLLIFALPPAEIAVHLATEGGRVEWYLMTNEGVRDASDVERPRPSRSPAAQDRVVCECTGWPRG